MTSPAVDVIGVELVRVEPDAHRILGTEQLHAADALHAAHRVDDIGGEVVADIAVVHAAVFGGEADRQQERCCCSC